MDDTRDPPIETANYLSGVTVVNIGDVRVARGMSRRAHSSCLHQHMTYDAHERRIWCQDCEHDVEGYDAFVLLVDGYDRAVKSLERREASLAEAESFQLRSIAARNIDKAWRSRNMVPSCPHCHGGLMPEHFKREHLPMVGKDFATARQMRDKK